MKVEFPSKADRNHAQGNEEKPVGCPALQLLMQTPMPPVGDAATDHKNRGR
jgi:hypothetical protein